MTFSNVIPIVKTVKYNIFDVKFAEINRKTISQKIQASWHPGSPFDAHLMTLTSDNTLRLFNLDLEQEKAEETIRLSEGMYTFFSLVKS